MFPGPDPMGFVSGGVGRALMQFMHFSAIFAMLAVFGDLGDPVLTTLRGFGMTPWCVVLVCFWPIAIRCPSLGPFPSIGGGAHRPFTTL